MKKIMLALLIIAMIFTCGACRNNTPVEITAPCEHEWTIIYMHNQNKRQTAECKICHEVKIEPIDVQDIPSPTPDIDQICMHINHEVISNVNSHSLYRCKDCGNYWEIQSDEITCVVVQEWTPEEYESAEITTSAS